MTEGKNNIAMNSPLFNNQLINIIIVNPDCGFDFIISDHLASRSTSIIAISYITRVNPITDK